MKIIEARVTPVTPSRGIKQSARAPMIKILHLNQLSQLYPLLTSFFPILQIALVVESC